MAKSTDNESAGSGKRRTSKADDKRGTSSASRVSDGQAGEMEGFDQKNSNFGAKDSQDDSRDGARASQGSAGSASRSGDLSQEPDVRRPAGGLNERSARDSQVSNDESLDSDEERDEPVEGPRS